MKNLKIMIIAIALALVSPIVSANEIKPTKRNALQKEIISLIGNNVSSSENSLTTNSKATVKFMLNSNNEIIVVSTQSDCKFLDSYLKRKLNYKKVKTAGIKAGEIYTVPVRLVKR